MEYLHALNNINEKVKRIQDIASETNILAINASIEAARAGSYGAGFAVVANEIKNLSTNSAVAANEIFEVCKEMNTNIVSIENCFKEIIEFIRTDIAKSFSDMNDISGQLKDSMDATNNEIDRISKLVDNIQSDKFRLNKSPDA